MTSAMTSRASSKAEDSANPEDSGTSMEVSADPNEEKCDDKVETDQWPRNVGLTDQVPVAESPDKANRRVDVEERGGNFDPERHH
jgi:hypothetical protein